MVIMLRPLEKDNPSESEGWNGARVNFFFTIFIKKIYIKNFLF